MEYMYIEREFGDCFISHSLLCYSRNQLSYLPEFIGRLRALEVMLASNNRLVSLPEEIGELENLMDIVSARTCASVNDVHKF